MAEVLGQSLPLVLTVVGILLVIAEAMAPGAHLIVLGVAVLAAGLIAFLVPSPAQPLVAAATVLVAGSAALYVYRRFDFYGGKGTSRTSDSETLVGEEGRVIERVTPTSGRVRLRDGGFDPVFTARSVDGEIPEGAEIIVVDPGGGSVLTVESVDGLDDIDRELERERDRVRRERERESDRVADADGSADADADAGSEPEPSSDEAGDDGREADRGEPAAESGADADSESDSDERSGGAD